MRCRPLRHFAIPTTATLVIVVGFVQMQFGESVQASGDSWGAALAAIGITALILWALVALPWVREARPAPPRTRQTVDDAIDAFVGWLFQVVFAILVLGTVVGGIAWVAVRVYRLLQ